MGAGIATTVVLGVFGGAASALGGWAFGQLHRLRRRKAKLEERIMKLEAPKKNGCNPVESARSCSR